MNCIGSLLREYSCYVPPTGRLLCKNIIFFFALAVFYEVIFSISSIRTIFLDILFYALFCFIMFVFCTICWCRCLLRSYAADDNNRSFSARTIRSTHRYIVRTLNSSPFFRETPPQVNIDNAEGMNVNQLRAMLLRFSLSHRNGDFSEEDYEMLQRLDELENESDSEGEEAENDDIESNRNSVYSVDNLRGRQGQNGLSKELISSLPTCVYTQNSESEDQRQIDSCSICLSSFVEDDVLRVLPCMHKYHCACIDKWLYKQSATCPICKASVSW